VVQKGAQKDDQKGSKGSAQEVPGVCPGGVLCIDVVGGEGGWGDFQGDWGWGWDWDGMVMDRWDWDWMSQVAHGGWGWEEPGSSWVAGMS